MHSTSVRAALVSAAVTLMTILPTAPPATAAGIMDPGLSDLVATLLPSVVNVTTTRYKEIQIVQGKSVMVQDAESDKKRAQGSGFIITPDGYVVTNKHVTRNGISYVVTFSDGRQFPADLVAQALAYDIAVLKIRSNETWKPVKIGDSNTLRQGDSVIAIGNPLGYSSTVTTGIISALNRDEGFTPFDDYIQTDAAINQGNSGGPLFNAKGEVIAVNSAIYTTGADTGNIGIGLAIPVNDAKFVVLHMRDAILGGKTFQPAYLGAAVQSLTPDLATAYGLPAPWGSIVAKVADGTAAAQANLRAGDVIVSYDGKDNKDSRALMRAIVETPAGATVTLGIWRDGKQENVPVTLTAMPADLKLPEFLAGGAVAKPDLPPEARVNFGLQFSAITPDLQAKYKLGAQQQGVVVTAVAIGSEAADRGINAGAVIVKVRDRAVASPDDVLKSVDNDRQQKRPFVPMLVSDANGIGWVPFPLN